MPPTHPLESFWDYREHFRRLARGEAVEAGSAETAGGYHAGSGLTPLNERLVQAIWSNQLLRGEGLRLADGRPLRVLDPGRWNGAAGADFKGARLMIGEETLQGDVEIHLDASGWRLHRHHADLDYNPVILHAVYRIDDGRATDEAHNGASVPRLEMEPYLFPDLETLRRSMTPDDYPYERPAELGRCHEWMTSAEPALAAGFLDAAGDERLEAKIRRLEAQLTGADPEQVFHQAFFMALGAGPGKTLYYLLAKRAPLAELLREAAARPPQLRERVLESILLHVAGLVPEELPAEAPPESAEHLARLREDWKPLSAFWEDRRLAPARRWFQNVRPVNFATRRLAAAALMIARAAETGRTPLESLEHRVRDLAGPLTAAGPAKRTHPALKDLIRSFEVISPRNFWTTHYSFAAAPAPAPMALLGESAARSICLNAAAPALAMKARLEGDSKLEALARRIYSIFPPLPENHVTAFMARRLFGEEGGRALLTTERRRQGLFQIFYSCCNGEERDCARCHYFTGS